MEPTARCACGDCHIADMGRFYAGIETATSEDGRRCPVRIIAHVPAVYIETECPR